MTSVIPEGQIKYETDLLVSLSNNISNGLSPGSAAGELVIITEIVQKLLPKFESLRLQAFNELNSKKGLSEITSVTYHEVLTHLEHKYREGYNINPSNAWFKCIQQASGIHLLSLVRSGSRESGPAQESTHGGKGWP